MERWILIGIEAPQKESSLCGALPHRKNSHREKATKSCKVWTEMVHFSSVAHMRYTPCFFLSDFEKQSYRQGVDRIGVFWKSKVWTDLGCGVE